ncbi:long-chain fatty acid--CoA ligase [Sulfurifustis variabilis]|uniref:Long-chain fatty acid--CoA ligase n=1 Tax=Sulfurifustis variabilis TaxID=1675686 RepID=A0A1B4V1S6_9GAMM|nr:AMP-binding protein [Sulfurifustis variabilis]BAU47393.1 long-chain fatty acid--CoA ligase [Sulfurifustis variabilis]
MRTIRHIVDTRAAEQPEKAYLIAPETGRTLNYGKLRRDARRLAAFLDAKGVRPGETVCLMMHNGYQAADLFLGIMYAGRVVSPINLLAQPAQLEYVLDHSDARLVFVAEAYRERLEAALARLDRPVAVEAIDVDAEALFPELAEGGSLPAVGEDDAALLMYTSGTTGRPKGALLTHRNVVAGGRFTSDAHELTESDRVLCSLPLYHINGQIVTTVAPLVHGGSVVMPHKFSVSSFWELLARHQCTWFNVVPTIVAYLLNEPDQRVARRELDLSRVRFGRSASAALPPNLHQAFERTFGFGIIETMGLTETAAPVFSNPLDPAKRKYGTPGRPFGVEAKIVDREGRALPPGEIGEILVRGDNVMKAYYKDPQNTAKALDADGWFHTGDLGYRDADGFYFVTGRLKELIIKGGENIAPREIDEALYRHPAVLEAAAVGIPDANYGQEILACVVLKPGSRCSEDELRGFCLNELGRYKTPKVIRFVDSIPKGPSGKVQRLKLLEI